MAYVELVIRIPDEQYKEISNSNPSYADDFPIYYAIKNGILLPEGHGRLKDIDEIEWYGCTTAFDCPYKERECKDCDRAECSKTQVDDIPTIIEADKESEDMEVER